MFLLIWYQLVSVLFAPSLTQGSLSNYYLQHGNPGPFVIGGQPALRNEFPYQLSLRRNGRHICGAVLVFPDKAITAARCVEIGTLPEFTLVAGEHSLRESDGTEQVRNLSSITMNPAFDSWTLDNDIALIQVAPAFTINQVVQAIDIPLQGQVASGSAIVSGWGVFDSDTGFLADILQKGQLNIVSNSDCQASYNRTADIPATAVCAGTASGVPDACAGDNGGPLVCANGGSPYLCGIFSWGNSLCNQTGYPGVYTDISYFSNWIIETSL